MEFQNFWNGKGHFFKTKNHCLYFKHWSVITTAVLSIYNNNNNNNDNNHHLCHPPPPKEKNKKIKINKSHPLILSSLLESWYHDGKLICVFHPRLFFSPARHCHICLLSGLPPESRIQIDSLLACLSSPVMYLPHRFEGTSRPHACGEICIKPGLMFQLYILGLGLTERVVISNL